MYQIAEAIDNATLFATCQGKYSNTEEEKDPKEEKKCVKVWHGSRKTLAAAMISMAVHESHLAQHIHENRCRLDIGECDARREWNSEKKEYVYFQQAFSLWQIQFFSDIPDIHQQAIQIGLSLLLLCQCHFSRKCLNPLRSSHLLFRFLQPYLLLSHLL